MAQEALLGFLHNNVLLLPEKAYAVRFYGHIYVTHGIMNGNSAARAYRCRCCLAARYAWAANAPVAQATLPIIIYSFAGRQRRIIAN
jgi:hypothetical protein